MSIKAIHQIVTSISSSGLELEKAFELTLQLLAWEKLSQRGKIADELKFSSEYVKTPEKILNVFQALSASGGLMQKGYINIPSEIRVNPYVLRDAVVLISRLRETGILENLDILNLAEGRFTSPTGRYSNIPGEVADLMVEIANINDKNSVYAPWDSSFAQLASRAAVKSSDVHYESALQSSIPSLISLLSVNEFKVATSDPILNPGVIEGGKPRLFDVTVAFSPFGVKYPLDEIRRDLFNRFQERTQIGSILAIRHALAQTRKRLVIAVQNSILFSHGYEKELRKDLVSKGVIEAVIAMPSGLLSHTNIAFTILVLNPSGGIGRIKFINADTSEFFESRSRTRNDLKNIEGLSNLIRSNCDSVNCSVVSIDRVLSNDVQLQVDRYVISDTRRQLENQLSGVQKVRLDEIISTVRSIPIGVVEEKSIEVIEIGAVDLPQFGFIESKGKVISVDENLAKRYEDCFLRPLDIVLIVKGSVGKIGLVPKNVPPPGNGGWVAGQSAIVLRAYPGCCPQSLFVQLRSSMGQALLQGIVSGATIKLIQLRELLKLEVVKSSGEQDLRSIEIMDSEEAFERQVRSIKREQELLSKNMWNLS